jgi:hypothetical protein
MLQTAAGGARLPPAQRQPDGACNHEPFYNFVLHHVAFRRSSHESPGLPPRLEIGFPDSLLLKTKDQIGFAS